MNFSTPRLFTNINSSSPLKHDYPMLDGAMRLARLKQPVFITPFTLAGAMAPVTMAGAVVQQNAESLACIALLQQINPGTPIVYGAFTSNVDMKTGAPAFGTPEYIRAMQMSGQMARYYNVPWRGSNANAANAPDAQAMWESAFSLNGVISGHANFIYHAAGWLEGGLSASMEKFVLDCEMLQQILYLQRPVEINSDALAVDAIAEVGPHGHFFDVTIPKVAISRHFTIRSYLTGLILKIGKIEAHYGHMTERIMPISKFWTSLKPRPLMRRLMKNYRPL